MSNHKNKNKKAIVPFNPLAVDPHVAEQYLKAASAPLPQPVEVEVFFTRQESIDLMLNLQRNILMIPNEQPGQFFTSIRTNMGRVRPAIPAAPEKA